MLKREGEREGLEQSALYSGLCFATSGVTDVYKWLYDLFCVGWNYTVFFFFDRLVYFIFLRCTHQFLAYNKYYWTFNKCTLYSDFFITSIMIIHEICKNNLLN